MEFDYSRLRGKIIEIFGSQTAFAKAAGISEQSVSGKLTNRIAFTQIDMITWANTLGIAMQGFIMLQIRSIVKLTGETIGKIKLTSKSENPYADKYIDKLNALKILPELFENAIYLDSVENGKEKNAKKQIFQFHHFVAPLYMNNKEKRVVISAVEKVNSDVIRFIAVDILPQKSRAAARHPFTDPVSIGQPYKISIADLIRGVKIWDYKKEEFRFIMLQIRSIVKPTDPNQAQTKH